MEFELIHRHFKTPFAALVDANRNTVLEGIGDDCAALELAPNHRLYVSTDTLVEGVHFFLDDAASVVGWKCLASNLSDLAACGASPLGFTLNLSLPSVDDAWLSGFSGGLLQLANQFNCPLVGGDTTSSGVNTVKTISVTVYGQAPASHKGFHRRGAQVGDEVWVSGTPGLAKLGLLLEFQRHGQLAAFCTPDELPQIQNLLQWLPLDFKQRALAALQKPMPRIGLGQALHGLGNACIDLSDGLSGDLAHISHASRLALVLSVPALRALWLQACPPLANAGAHQLEVLLDTLVSLSLQGGDDFELCFTACPNFHGAIELLQVSPTCIGTVEIGDGVWAINQLGRQPRRLLNQSYRHFTER